jgi:hypothetical protein
LEILEFSGGKMKKSSTIKVSPKEFEESIESIRGFTRSIAKRKEMCWDASMKLLRILGYDDGVKMIGSCLRGEDIKPSPFHSYSNMLDAAETRRIMTKRCSPEPSVTEEK